MVVIVAVVAAMSVGVAGAQSASTTTVDSCVTIDSSGKYVLTQDITSTTESDEGCITITTGNVTLDGAGHTVQGSGSGYGIYVDGSARAVTNVTVRNVQTSNWAVGVFYLGVDNGTIRGTIAEDNIEGIKLAQSDRNRLVDNTAYANSIGIAIGGESQNNTLLRNVAVENKWGIHFERDSQNNTVINSVARNNTNWDFFSLRNSGTNTVRNLELTTTTVSFTGQNVALRSETSPPPLPQGTQSLGTFVEVTETSGGVSSELSLTMSYDAPGGSSVTLYRHDGRYWSPVPQAEVDASANTVSVSNLTEFGVFAPLADAPNSNGGPVNVTTDQPVSVQRTLTTVPQPTPTATSTSSDSSAGTDASTTMDSRISTTTSNASTETTADVVSGESDAVTSTFGVGPVRLFFVFLGVVALVGLALVAVRERTEDGGPGFNR